jgi:tRNA1(Val) A37 N6-methylase TrmN6
MSTSQFSELTLKVTQSLTKQEKKEYGIFISPNSIISRLFSTILEYLENDTSSIKRILEPSCGTCEIINYLDQKLDNIEIDGIELNPKIYGNIKDLTFKNNVKIYNQDFIKYTCNNLYHLIIGNPPYFVCKKSDIPKEYDDYIHGRPNIFGLFILHSLRLLKPGGILAFIIPNSFLNSLYYSKIRNYIKQTCTIIKIEEFRTLNDFIDTEQSTFGLIIKKNIIEKTTQDKYIQEECNYSMLFNGNFIFTNDSKELKEIFKNSTTIQKMGLAVRTGQIVWNEVKDELTNNDNDTILIYNSNISKDNKFEAKEFKNDEKKQYINRDGRIDPVLVVNRGNGNSDYKLNYAIIKTGPFLIENHLNEIYSPKKINTANLLKIYEKIIKSFEHPKTKKFIEIFLGNNSLSKTELETIFPIYDI